LLCFCQLCFDLFAVGFKVQSMSEELSSFLHLSLFGLHHTCRIFTVIGSSQTMIFIQGSQLPYAYCSNNYINHVHIQSRIPGTMQVICKPYYSKFVTKLGIWFYHVMSLCIPSMLRKPNVPICPLLTELVTFSITDSYYQEQCFSNRWIP